MPNTPELRARVLTLAVATTALFARGADAQPPSPPDINAANNPLTPKITVNLHDQASLQLYDSDQGSNAFLFRGVVPHKLGGRGQIFRFTMPLVTAPGGNGSSSTGLGDLNVMDLFPFPVKRARMELGVGPQLTLPTATDDLTGTGKWQAGVVGLAMAPRSWGIGGALVTWQHSFAGNDDRPTQHNLTVQPLFIYNLPRGWYLRSTATWNFDLARDHYVIPLGAGAGKVFQLQSGTTVNLLAEPQFTVAHSGAGQPQLQLFTGVNLQFPLRAP